MLGGFLSVLAELDNDALVQAVRAQAMPACGEDLRDRDAEPRQILALFDDRRHARPRHDESDESRDGRARLPPVTIGPQLAFATNEYMDAYFGIRGDDSRRSGLRHDPLLGCGNLLPRRHKLVGNASQQGSLLR